MNSSTEKELSSIQKSKEKRRASLYVLLLMVFLLTLETGIFLILFSGIRERREKRQYEELNTMVQVAELEFNSIALELNHLTRNSLAQSVLTENDANSQRHLTSIMCNMMAFDTVYDQIRIIDSTGHEVIRVDNIDEKVVVIPDSLLQDKSKRYYFTDAIVLDSNDVYVSDFDLNIEKGVLSLPHKPMIRYAQTVIGNDGNAVGIGILNYKGKHLLNKLKDKNIHKGDRFFLLNSDGYYLLGEDSTDEWGFMIPERKNRTFSNDYGSLWEEIAGKELGKVRHKSGEFYFQHIPLSTFTPSEERGKDLILIMSIPTKNIRSELKPLLIGLSIGFCFLAPLLIFLGWRLGRYQERHRWFVEQLEHEATHDPLTGLYNRRAIMDILKRHVNLSLRRGTQLSVGFIDVNDLKKLNDEVGHDAGDSLIKGTSLALKGLVRETDAVARLGGDEFLVVFPDCPQKEAERIMKRIQMCLSSLGYAEMDREWTMSCGCSELEKDDIPEKLIERADQRMYEQKLRTKHQNGEEPR